MSQRQAYQQPYTKDQIRNLPEKPRGAGFYLLRVFLVILGLFLGFSGYIWNMLGKPGFVSVPVISGDETVSGDDGTDSGTDLTVGDVEGDGGVVKVYAPSDYPIQAVDQMDSQVTNILIFGVDSRGEDDTTSRSDSMMVMSLNRKTKSVKLTSLMRDTQVTISGYEDEATKLNAAYAYGGVGLMINTINQNYQLDIQKFMMFDFWSAADLIDQVGGIELDITEEELPYVNDNMVEVNRISGLADDDGALAAAGTQTVTGKQAIAWARIRSIGNDQGRTARQRTVVIKMLEKFSAQSLPEKLSTVNEGLGHIETNLTQADMLSLGLKNINLLGNFEQMRIPEDGYYQTNEDNWNMIVDWDSELPRLHDFIFED
ncbi:MAG: LCP family protein [Oscillospiraceae bacterium]|nr:LCP family protein [Oscillospiraceae bacterium]MDD4368595.1 LCP family protein [Oscillospiraceae bacterium]